MKKEKLGIISGVDAIRFIESLENPKKISSAEKNKIIENYNKINDLIHTNYDHNSETIQEKIRNNLSQYWILIDIIDDFENKSEENKENVWKIIKKTIKNIKKSQVELLTLIDSTKNEN